MIFIINFIKMITKNNNNERKKDFRIGSRDKFCCAKRRT